MSLHLPRPDLINPSAVPSLRWGIFGTGWISEEFATSCVKHTSQRIVSVASRTPGAAEAFANKVGGLEVDESYETLAARHDIDAIYIATRPGKHLEHALIAINAGKHALIEKPITVDVEEAETLFAAARAKGVFAMEAMWPRYLPQASIVRKLREQDLLGEPQLILIDFCQDHRDLPSRWESKQGSAMYDMGVYPVAFSIEFMGYPTSVQAIGKYHKSGFESEVTAVLDYANGARCIMTLSALTHAPHHATVSGTKGILEYATPFVLPTGVSLSRVGFNEPLTSFVDDYEPKGHQGLCYEVTAFASFVDQGLVESPFHPHEQSVQAIKLIEEILDALKASQK